MLCKFDIIYSDTYVLYLFRGKNIYVKFLTKDITEENMIYKVHKGLNLSKLVE